MSQTKPSIKEHASLSPLEKDFLAIFSARIPSQDERSITSLSREKLAQKFASLFESIKSNDTKIDVFTPNMKENGWEHDRTIIHVVTPDRPFILDSIAAALISDFASIGVFVHPIILAKRDKKGHIVDIEPVTVKTKGSKDIFSCIYIELSSIISSEQIKNLSNSLNKILSDVHLATSDWQDMLGVADGVLEDLKSHKKKLGAYDNQEYIDLLEYLKNDNFTFLGYRYISISEKSSKLESAVKKTSRLGLFKDQSDAQKSESPKDFLPKKYKDYIEATDLITVLKDTQRSTVHRRSLYDVITIKDYNSKGKLKGEHMFLGLFTSATYSRSVFDIPLVRKKVEAVFNKSEDSKRSHNKRAMRHILERYPREELFIVDEDVLYENVTRVLSIEKRQLVSMFPRLGPYKKLLSCLLYIPRDRFETNMRLAIQQFLEDETKSECVAFSVVFDDSTMIRVQFMLKLLDKNIQFDFKKLEQKVTMIARSWSEKFEAELIDKFGQEQALGLIETYEDAFSSSYKEHYDAALVGLDVEAIEQAFDENRLQVHIYRPSGVRANRIRLRLYQINKPIILSEILPMITSIGLRAISEIPTQVKPLGRSRSIWIHDLLLELNEAANDSIKVADVKSNFEEVIKRLWYKDLSQDILNSLVVSAGLDWRAVQLLRAFAKYMQQIKYPYSYSYVTKTLAQNPEFCAKFWALFEAQFNPDIEKDSDVQSAGLMVEIEHMLDDVMSLDHDRILRSLMQIIRATLRTNFYQIDMQGNHRPQISLKIKSNTLSDAPDPKPWVEIFVFSSVVEGVHLRFGPIARGGLRWSDRPEDFRTEILGLVKAQMVKNSVIVPVGSKGGFVIKKNLQGLSREDFQKEGVEAYKIFIRGLLDITDNKVGDDVISPERTVCRDQKDPYFVVAADKGTATFSDIANGISDEYGFWLGDAFASGGSVGYDHKKMGITAKGAWESVKRHFREFNHDTQAQEFSVVGVGDMGGDVFGNGMLLSEHIQLIGAFNHLHIFCDPNPDAAKTFKERKRLFESVKGWGDYNEKYLSKGGRIFERSAKVLKLTKEIKERFDIDQDSVSPDELMKAMLKARTDLLWFGGIGTYIKSSDETNIEAADKANDVLRINGSDVRAKVVGEGANLGVTQKGRIEYAFKGGKINTDFIDNSGGVDCSDHEVNLKILLQSIPAFSDRSKPKERNKLLEKMTEDVSDLVLRNNYVQSQVISLMEINAARNANKYETIMQTLEGKVGLRRDIEFLPSNEDMEERITQGKGLTRPELAVILSYSKISFFNDLMDAEFHDENIKNLWLKTYFPERLQEKYKGEIYSHALSEEIANTQIANDILNRAGPTFILKCVTNASATPADIVRAFYMVVESFDIRSIWDAVERLDNKIPADLQYKIFLELDKFLEHICVWFLKNKDKINLDPERISSYRQVVNGLVSNLSAYLPDAPKKQFEDRLRFYKNENLDDRLANLMASLPFMLSICDISFIYGDDMKADYKQAAKVYYEVGEIFKLDWLRDKSRSLNLETIWDRKAASGLREQLFQTQAHIARQIMQDKSYSGDMDVQGWLDKNPVYGNVAKDVRVDIETNSNPNLSMLVLAEQRLRKLA